jgi:hypothetical protein
VQVADSIMTAHHKALRRHASEFFVAGELCRRGHAAVVTLGNTPNVDILCSNLAGTRFAHIQVKTFEPGSPSDHMVRIFGAICGATRHCGVPRQEVPAAAIAEPPLNRSAQSLSVFAERKKSG